MNNNNLKQQLLNEAVLLDPECLNEGGDARAIAAVAIAAGIFSIGAGYVLGKKEKKDQIKRKEEQLKKDSEKEDAQSKENNNKLQSLDLDVEMFKYNGNYTEVTTGLICNLIVDDYKKIASLLKNNKILLDEIEKMKLNLNNNNKLIPGKLICKPSSYLGDSTTFKNTDNNEETEITIELFDNNIEGIGAPSCLNIIPRMISTKYNKAFTNFIVRWMVDDEGGGYHYITVLKKKSKK